MYKAHGKSVISNDYMAMGAVITKALVENNGVVLPIEEARDLMVDHGDVDTFVTDTFNFMSPWKPLFVTTYSFVCSSIIVSVISCETGCTGSCDVISSFEPDL